jgi:hypothetical protein
VWNPAKERIHQFNADSRWGFLQYVDLGHDGTLGPQIRSNSVYHSYLAPPFLVSPAGDGIVTGSGTVFNADTLEPSYYMTNGFKSATWLGNELYTARETPGRVEVQRWDGSSFALIRSINLSGYLVDLVSVESKGLVAVTSQNGNTRFTILDAELDPMIRMDAPNVPLNNRMVSISTRAEIGVNENVVIAGFAVSGTGTKKILVRGIGPSLQQFQVTDALSDPVLSVNVLGGAVIAENDDWSSNFEAELIDAFGQVFAFPLISGTADAAVLLDVEPGSYTAVVSGKSGGSGVVLVEIYDMDEGAAGARLASISTRAFVGTGSRILIPGLSVEGPEPSHVLIRGIGPELTHFGVGGAIANPQIAVTTLQGQVIAANDDWGRGNAFEAAGIAAQIGAFSLSDGSADAAFIYTLPPGVYTFQMSGVAGSTGVGLVEIYELK